MKARTVHQFYFPFVLPRAPDWPVCPFGLSVSDLTTFVLPRGAHEPLFPEEIDQTLSHLELTLSRISEPTSTSVRRVRDGVHDRIGVLVEGTLAASEEAQRPDTHERFLAAAILACNTFIAHCRVVARSPFLNGVERHYRLEDGRYYVLTPYTVAWFDADTGERLPSYVTEGDPVNARCSAGALSSPEHGAAPYSTIRASMAAGEEPSLPLSLLVDAAGWTRTLRLREAVLASASACEVAVAEYGQRCDRTRYAAATRVINESKARRPTFAERHFHLVPQYVSGRSLQAEDVTTFDLVESMYQTRNKVAHEGRLYYRGGDGREVTVDQVAVVRFLAASERAVAWLSRL